MIRYALISVLLGGLGACSPSGVVKMLTGGGPNVAANVQAGKANVQSVGGSAVTDQKIVRPQARKIEQISGDNEVKADQVRDIHIHNEAPMWVWLALIVFVGMAGYLIADEIQDRRRKKKQEGK